jgi:DNA-binding LytR/AlgR family response regulator
LVYTYIILDSEISTTLNLEHFLAEYLNFDSLAISENSEDGMNAILNHRPDIVFIHLNENAKSCFKMCSALNQYTDKPPIFIGISRTKKYAYKAIENNFFDYWLLPYDKFDVRKAFELLKRKLSKEEASRTRYQRSFCNSKNTATDYMLYLKVNSNSNDFTIKNGAINKVNQTLKKSKQNQLPLPKSYRENLELLQKLLSKNDILPLN